jgi:hypothetical protein
MSPSSVAHSVIIVIRAFIACVAAYRIDSVKQNVQKNLSEPIGISKNNIVGGV